MEDLNLINDLKRKNAKEIILSYISGGEVVGVDEIILKYERRQASLKVSSEAITVLYVERKNFLERVFYPHP